MTQLENAVVLITGASGGFGQELTRQLLTAGSQLILTDLDAERLTHQVEAIQARSSTGSSINGNTPGNVLGCIAADLSSKEGCEGLYQQVHALEHPVDVLINNAGIGLFGRMDEVPPEEWEQLMQVNLLAPMRLSALFSADMIARTQGHIVNISSLAGWLAPAGMAHYGASKFGLRGFSDALAQEVKPYGVHVTAVYPFFSRTPILASKRFGTLSNDMDDFPVGLATDPAKVMRATIRAIERDRPTIFPDPMAQILSRLTPFLTPSIHWIIETLMRRQQHRDP
jgi:short-subunit dehydrogenase